jgi:precorrin-2 methylase
MLPMKDVVVCLHCLCFCDSPISRATLTGTSACWNLASRVTYPIVATHARVLVTYSTARRLAPRQRYREESAVETMNVHDGIDHASTEAVALE